LILGGKIVKGVIKYLAYKYKEDYFKLRKKLISKGQNPMKNLLLLAAVVFFFTAGTVTAQKAPADAKIKMCNSCHKEGKNKFDEFKAWLQTNHAKVTEAFDKPEAKEIADKNKVANPKEAAACLSCHVDKMKVENFNPKDIDCMSCHNPESKVHAIPEKVTHPSAKKAGTTQN